MKNLIILLLALLFAVPEGWAQRVGAKVGVGYNTRRKQTQQTQPPVPPVETAYYVSYSSGSNLNDGLSPSSPKQSFGFSINSSDQVRKVYFKRGETWYGFNKSIGALQDSFLIGAYGTGPAPRLLGSNLMTGWTKRSSTNVYVTRGLGTVYQLFMNGVRMKEARHPNTGYDYIETVNSTSSFTSTELNPAVNYTGAKWIGRTNPYAMPTQTVTASSSKTLTLNSGPFGDLTTSTEGFILVGKFELLDSPGEWFYNSGNDSLYFWAPGSDDPDNYTMTASKVLNGITLGAGSSKMVIQDVELSEYANYAIYAVNGNNRQNTVLGNIFNNNGYAAMLYSGAGQTGHIVQNNQVKNSSQMGMELFAANSIVDGNQVDSIAIFDHLGSSGIGSWYKGSGIYVEGNDNVIRYNRVTNSGYNGIHFANRNVVEYNYVRDCNLTKDDGGGIYTSSGAVDYYPAPAPNHGSIIRYNIIDGSWGTLNGFTTYGYTLGEGVYGDESSSGNHVYGNSVGNVTSGAYYMHKGYEHVIRDNISYRARYGVMLKHKGYNVVVRKNKLYGFSRDFNNKQSEQMVWKFGTTTRPSIDSNIYIQHYKSADIFADSITNYSFANWKTATGKDAASTVDNTALPANYAERWVYNASKSPKTYYLNNASNVTDAFSDASVAGSFTLDKFRSIVLEGLNLDCIDTIQDNIAPTMVAFSIPEATDTLIISITSFSTSVGATKYIITETATAPALVDPRWSTTIPATYTFTSQGTKTLYAWCRDAAGNVSASLSDVITVDLVFPSSPLAVWEFEETSGTVAFDTVGTNNGTIAGGVTLNQTGKIDKAFLFDGVDDKVTMAAPSFVNSGMTQDFSVSIWIKPVVVATYKAFLQTGYNNNDYLAFHTNSSSRLCAYVRSANVLYMFQTSAAINNSNWYNAVMTWTASTKTLKFYLNGVLQTSTSTDYIGRDATSLTIGGTGGANRWSNAIIDQVIVDNKVWTPEQIRNISLGIGYPNW